MQLLMVLSQAEAAADVAGDAADADVADARQVMWSTRQGGQIRSFETSRQPGQPRQPLVNPGQLRFDCPTHLSEYPRPAPAVGV